MTKRIARIAVVAAAAAAFALPASSAHADVCVPFGTFEICPLPPVNG